jgi:hypothetical protein
MRWIYFAIGSAVMLALFWRTPMRHYTVAAILILGGVVAFAPNSDFVRGWLGP